MAFIVLVLLAIAGVALWGVISPRGQWWTLSSWTYRNPAANEPSDIAYTLTRIGCAVVLVIVVVALVRL